MTKSSQKKGFKITRNFLYSLVWIQAVVATVGSLFFSDVLGYPPCKLCWVQRIFIYPLVFIVGVGILKNDKKLPDYVLPLTITGLFIAIYHNLLSLNIIPENTAPCEAGISCTTKYIELFGFVTIPMLSLLAFIFMTAVMMYAKKLKD